MDPHSSLPIRPGETIAGKYRVERVLGQGGMGVVLAVTHLKLGKPRAIKLIRSDIAATAAASRRFLREAQAACDLRSEHVARVLDVDQLATGEPFMVMEYLEGADLARVLEGEGPLPAGEAVRYVRQACEALAEAHAAGVVHRDIKPANLFLTRGADQTPAVKVLDFGIAKASSAAGDSVGQSGSSAFLGTMHYSAPEQITAEQPVDARTDLWALCVVLYELLCGRPPFHSESAMQLFAMITESAPPPLSGAAVELPDGLEAVVMRCLEKDREKRPPSASALREILAPFEAPADEASMERLSRTGQDRAARQKRSGDVGQATSDGATSAEGATITGPPTADDRHPTSHDVQVPVEPALPLARTGTTLFAAVAAIALAAGVAVFLVASRSDAPASASSAASAQTTMVSAAPTPKDTAATGSAAPGRDKALPPGVPTQAPSPDGATSGSAKAPSPAAASAGPSVAAGPSAAPSTAQGSPTRTAPSAGEPTAQEPRPSSPSVAGAEGAQRAQAMSAAPSAAPPAETATKKRAVTYDADGNPIP